MLKPPSTIILLLFCLTRRSIYSCFSLRWIPPYILSYSECHCFSLKDSGPLVILLFSCICDILTPSLTAVINLLGYFPPKSIILIYTYFQSWLLITAPLLGIFHLNISQMSTVPLIQGTIINIINILGANLKSAAVYSLKVCVCLCLCVVCVSMCVYVWHVCVLCYVCGGQRKTFRSCCFLVPGEYRRQKIRLVVSLRSTFSSCAVLIALYC